MRTMMRGRLAIAAGLLIAGVSSSGCAPSVIGALDCSDFISDGLRTRGEITPPPEDNSTGGWVQVADARAGDVDKEGDRADTVIHICDTVKVQNEKLTRKRWLGLF